MVLPPRIFAAFLTTLASFALTTAFAGATGTVSITRANGTVNAYDDVEVKVLSGELFLTSHDGEGTIVVNQAACSYQGKIIVCYPTAAALVQGGSSHALALKSGTIYLNYTDDAQPLSSSSSKVPAHSVIAAFTTTAGTFVTAQGRIDEVIKQ